MWDRAEGALRARAGRDRDSPYAVNPGDGAFYGPKIDFDVADSLGRKWQLGTIQLDYAAPERFGLEYVGEDNAPHRPVVIHRAVSGSFERFIAILIEHFAGAFPLWLAPEQMRRPPHHRSRQRLRREGAARLAPRPASGRGWTRAARRSAPRFATRSCRRSRSCWFWETARPRRDTVAVRSRRGGDEGAQSLEAFLERAQALASSKSNDV